LKVIIDRYLLQQKAIPPPSTQINQACFLHHTRPLPHFLSGKKIREKSNRNIGKYKKIYVQA
jgi:hypothetical protein